MKILFVGAGNMADALVTGILKKKVASPAEIRAVDVSAERRAHFHAVHGVHVTPDLEPEAAAAEVVVLAVKPQQMSAVLQKLAGVLNRETLVISIAAGLPAHLFEKSLGGTVRVVRAMPNTPALIGMGATAICAGRHAGEQDLLMAERLMGAAGICVRVPEAWMDAVTAVSGSGPAYVFYLMEAMLRAAEQFGMAPEIARALVVQTVAGAAQLCEESDATPEELRCRVTSAGGTTAAAVAVLEENKAMDTLVQALDAARRRAGELSRAAEEVRQ